MTPRILDSTLMFACLLLLHCSPSGSRQPEEVYEFHLEANQYIALTVEQQGKDVALFLEGPRGQLFQVDSPTNDQGKERLELLAETAGLYRMRIKSGVSAAGGYAITATTARMATPQDRKRSTAAAVVYEGDDLRRSKQWEAAIDQYEHALELWRQLDDTVWQAETYDRIGYCQMEIGEEKSRRLALDAFQHAADVFFRVGEEARQAQTLNNMGLVLFELDQIELTSLHFELALRIVQRLQDPRMEAALRSSLGQSYRIQGRVQQAQDQYRKALDISQTIGDREFEANTLSSLGVLYRFMGEWDRAEDCLKLAMAIWIELKEPSYRATALNQLGQLYADKGEQEAAFEHYREALKLRRALEEQDGEASTLWRIGRAQGDTGQLQQGVESCRESQALASRLGDSRILADALSCLGSLYAELGEQGMASSALRAARKLYGEIGDPFGEALSWRELAHAAYRWGDLQKAHKAIEQALTIAERVRMSSGRQEMRWAYFATVQSDFELAIDVLMDLGHEELAFELSERARVRSLLDLLSAAGVDHLRDADPQMLRQERRLHDAFYQQLREPDTQQEAASVNRSEKDLLDLLTELDRVRGRILADQPPPKSIDLSDAQALLDPDTLLLTFRLGERRSHLWLVTPNRFDTFELPARKVIGNAAAQAYESLEVSHHPHWRLLAENALCHLSKLILGPAAGELDGQHLLIIADGPLHRIPFAALPDPTAGGDCERATAEPLIERHEVTYLPSVSALAALRHLAGSRSATDGVAVLADPVFELNDSRLRLAPGSQLPMASAGETLPRLPDTRQEAADILAAAAPRRTFEALGFEAAKTTVTDGKLAGYQIVHFATHAKIDNRFPELSYLALSRFDEQGRQRDGELRGHEIHGLELPAELVVLSACESALGKDVAGEGLVGLTQGFFSAGAARVMVSLWRVEDRSTRVFMKDFYSRLLQDGHTPSAALRETQRAMRRQEAFASPFAWAGWAIQGEWRPLDNFSR